MSAVALNVEQLVEQARALVDHDRVPVGAALDLDVRRRTGTDQDRSRRRSGSRSRPSRATTARRRTGSRRREDRSRDAAGWSRRASHASRWPLLGWRGSLRMSMFHTLSTGKTEHAVPGTSAAPAGIDGTAERTSAAAAIDLPRMRFISRVSVAATVALSSGSDSEPVGCRWRRSSSPPPPAA